MKKFAILLALFASVPSLAWAHGASPPHRRESRPSPPVERVEPTQAFPTSATSGDYRLTIRSSTSLVAGRSARLEIALARSGEAVENLEIVHERPMHLIAVSRDLGHFLHLHPTPRPGGILDVEATFPEGGEWVLFADFTERERDRTVIRIPLRVAGEAEHGHGLEVSGFPLRDGATGTQILLVTDPPALRTGENRLTFRLSTSSGPVTDLEPVLGSLGHLVVIREGARLVADYLHAHPEGGAHAAHDAEMPEMGATADAPAGEVAFGVEFPSAGRYKAWVEFNRGGRQVLLPFVVEVRPPAPASRPVSARFTCPMHPEVDSPTSGKCPICQMDLVARSGQPATRPESEGNHDHDRGGHHFRHE